MAQRFGVGIQLAGLRQPFKQSLLTAARLGADAVEIDARSEVRPGDVSQTGLRQLRKMLDDLNLRVSVVRFATERGYNVAAELDRRIAATKAAMQLAYSLGAPAVANGVGRIPEGAEGTDWDLLVEVLDELGRFGDRVGARLAARTYDDPTLLERLIDRLSPGAIGVDLDPGALIVGGFSPLDAAARVGRHVVHVHARDAVRDVAARRGVDVVLGRGSADFPALLGALEEHSYRGDLTIERRDPTAPVEEIENAVAYLKSLR
jgi:sugar phosphate isomerase/epimerase